MGSEHPAPAGERPGRPFLTARWSHLFLASFVTPPELLRPRLPPGLELDTRDGHCFVSLVAFDFLDTRVLGIPWPGFRNFPEINLRFYVRRGGERGVVFVREFVPQGFVAWMARTLYNEPYAAATMASTVTDEADHVRVEHRLTWAGRTNVLRVTGNKPAYRPAADSTEVFFKEHSWGYGVTRAGKTLRYEVRHPEWDVYPVREYALDLDWAAVYGPEWRSMQGATPVSTVLAVGSGVAVYPQGTL
jgi:uncharacterized protein YqjF (DUF2071 family)